MDIAAEFGDGGRPAAADGEDPFAYDPFGLDNEVEAAPGEPPSLRTALLFVVDCSSSASLTPLQPGGRSPVATALAAAASVLKTKVITSPDDRVGIVLYGVREKHNPVGFEGIRVLQELDRPSAQRIRQLEQEVSRTAEQFEERYGHRRPVPLSDVFWTCITIFNLSANPKQFQPRVFLFTGSDTPCSTLAEQDAAVTRAKDLLDLGVEVELFPVTPPGSTFSIERFWGRVLPVDSTDYVEQASVRIEELERRVRRRVHKKRNLQRLTLELVPGVEVAMGIYCHMIQATIPLPVPLNKDNNKVLKAEMKNLCEQTGGILRPDEDIETFVEVGGQRVPISRKEATETKRFGEPGMKLLGFKPIDQLLPHHRVFHSYFVYPHEHVVAGSAPFCAALIDRMLKRRLMAIVRFIRSRNSIPAVCALLPQAEVEEEGGDQLSPPGFHMVLLPFADEIRRLDLPVPAVAAVSASSPVAAAAATAASEGARRVVEAMQINGFTPGCIENPVLQRHYAAVQALALSEDQPEETPDVLQPDRKVLAEKAPILAEWRALTEAASTEAAEAWPTRPAAADTGRRRAGPISPARGPAGGFEGGFDYDAAFDEEDGGRRAAKRPRYENRVLTQAEMRECVWSNEVERLTASTLRDYLRAEGIATSGKKSDLVERVRSCI